MSLRMENPIPAPILLAEDNDDDIALIQFAFRKANIFYPVHVVRDGEGVLSYLNGTGDYADRAKYPIPQLLLLELELPGLNGFETLKRVRGNPTLSHLKIIILTGSEEPGSADKAHQLGANGFFAKPPGFSELVRIANILKERELSPILTLSQRHKTRGSFGSLSLMLTPQPW
jgi:CheY-like chemotaxis protein